MNYTKYSSSVPDKEDDSMEWEEDKDNEKPGACVGEDGTSVDPHIAHGYNFSQPGTSGYTGQKRKSTFSSSSPTKISRNNWNGKQQEEEYPSVNETNLCNIPDVTSGFSTAPPIPQMMIVKPHGISNQAESDNASANVISDDTSCSKGDISAESIHGISTAAGTTREFHSFPDLDEAREKIINLLYAELLPIHTKNPLIETEETVQDIERFIFLLNKIDLFCNTLKLPERYSKVLRRHLKRHLIDEPSVGLYHFQLLATPARESSCSICQIFFSFLTPPNSLPG